MKHRWPVVFWLVELQFVLGIIKSCCHKSGERRAFAMVELLVAIGIMAVIFGLTMPAIQAVRQTAIRTRCGENLRQIALGLHQFDDIHGHLPAGIQSSSHIAYPRASFLTMILPLVEERNLWDYAVAQLPSALPLIDHRLLRTVIGKYQCPSDTRSGRLHWTHDDYQVATTSYLGVCGTNYSTKDGVLFHGSAIDSADILDGLSNTLLIGERPPSADLWYGWWYSGGGQEFSGSPDMLLGVREVNDKARYAEHCPHGPYQFSSGEIGQQCDVFHFWSLHPNGANFAYCDGAVRFLSYHADEVLPALGTRSGQEIFELKSY